MTSVGIYFGCINSNERELKRQQCSGLGFSKSCQKCSRYDQSCDDDYVVHSVVHLCPRQGLQGGLLQSIPAVTEWEPVQLLYMNEQYA